MKLLKRKEFKQNFWGKAYDDYLYKGLTGLFLKINHKIINSFSKKKEFKVIMEFGGAGKPHWNFMSKSLIKNVKKYILVDDKTYFKRIKIPKELLKKIVLIDYRNQKKINFFRHKVDRIIASHVLEHISSPEEAVIKWVNLLKLNGSLCIALPCDPGIIWRTGQLLSMRKACKLYKMNSYEKDLWQSREHRNSVQNLYHIFNFYFKKRKEFWFPFIIPIININLFYIIEVNKNDI